MTIDADDTVSAGVPYLVRVGLTDVADIPVYNASAELLPGGEGYIYQPDQHLSYGTAVIQPGETFWTDYYRLLPIANGENPLNLQQSFVEQTGGNTDVESTIVDHPPTPGLAATATSQPSGVQLNWTPSSAPGITGYDIFYTPNPSTPFGNTPIATVSASTTSKLISHAPSGYYAVSTVTSSGLMEYHTLVEATPLDASTAVVLTPTTLAGSGKVVMSGSGFAPGPVTIYLGTITSKKVGKTTASSSGTFNANLKIPTSIGGSHTVIAVSADGTTATAALNVSAVVVTSPSKIAPGKTVKVNLTGFRSGEAIVLTIGNGPSAPTIALVADPNGAAEASITAPSAKGSVELSATGSGGSNAQGLLKVK